MPCKISLSIKRMIAMLILFIPNLITAQSYWLDRGNEQTLMLEVLKPVIRKEWAISDSKFLDESKGRIYGQTYITGFRKFYQNGWYPIDYSAFNSFMIFLSMQHPLGKKLFFIAELPYVHTEFDLKIRDEQSFFHYTGYESSIGNPYLGVEARTKSAWAVAGLGIRMPIISEKNIHLVDIGRNAVFDRSELFCPFASIKLYGLIRLKHRIGLDLQFGSGLVYSYTGLNENYHHFHVPSMLSLGFEKKRFSIRTFVVLGFEYGVYRGWGALKYGYLILGHSADIKLGNVRLGVQTVYSGFGLYLSTRM